jgi:predicted cupin superfamily sugar epimerase
MFDSDGAELARILNEYRLEPHPEGGWYRELYRSSTRVDTPRGERSALTLIHFALDRAGFSALHRLHSDETWHFITGAPIEVEAIGSDGGRVTHRLASEGPHEVVVPAGTLFGARVREDPGYALVACCVAPGFEFEDFELPSRAELLAAYPDHEEVIATLTREPGASR